MTVVTDKAYDVNAARIADAGATAAAKSARKTRWPLDAATYANRTTH